MITRPLNLASKLSTPTWGGGMFFVNVGLVVLFFGLAGSRFVMSPGLAVDFALPTSSAPATATTTADVVIAVPAAGIALVDGQVLDYNALSVWLMARGSEAGRHRLLVQAAASLPAKDIAEIYSLAADAGFAGVLIATEKQIGGAP